MYQDFRVHLKYQTAACHARVDRAISEMDVSRRDGLVSFLRVHAICFTAMRAVTREGSHARASLAQMIDCIDRDLGSLDAALGDHSVPQLGDRDELALDYIIEGSRLGSQVLKRRWASSRDSQVLSADAYFTLAPVAGRWRGVCDALSQLPAGSARALAIEVDTIDIFDMFYKACQLHGVSPRALERLQ